MKLQGNFFRCLLLLFFLTTTFSTVCAQGVNKVINKPIYAKTNADYLFLGYIMLKTDETVIEFELSTFEGAEFLLDAPGNEQAFVLQAEGRTYALKEVKGIATGKHAFSKTEVLNFQMIFEPLPVFAETFSLYTGKPGGDGLFFENVVLTELAEAQSKADGGYDRFQFILGSYYERLYEYDLAHKYFNMYIENIKKMSGENSSEYFKGLNMLIRLHTNLGNYEEAERLALLALKNPSNPDVADIMYSLADNYQILGKHKSAVETYIRYIRSMEAQKMLKSADYSTIYNLIKYSYGQIPDEERKPLCIGVSLNPAKLSSGTAEMRIFVTDIEQFAVSEDGNFKEKDWNKIPPPKNSDEPVMPYVLSEKKVGKSPKALFVKLKDSSGRESDVYEINFNRSF